MVWMPIERPKQQRKPHTQVYKTTHPAQAIISRTISNTKQHAPCSFVFQSNIIVLVSFRPLNQKKLDSESTLMHLSVLSVA